MRFQVKTRGHYDFIDISAEVRQAVSSSGVEEGIALVFVLGSTAAVTTMEYEEGLVKDLIRVFENMAPEDASYEHNKRWGDYNGAAHIKSAIVGTDLTLPVEGGRLIAGTWQQIVLIDFDERPRTREVVVKTVAVPKVEADS